MPVWGDLNLKCELECRRGTKLSDGYTSVRISREDNAPDVLIVNTTQHNDLPITDITISEKLAERLNNKPLTTLPPSQELMPRELVATSLEA